MMKYNKFFNPIHKQNRIEVKIKKYRDAISDIKIKNRITDMGYNQKTLDVIESALKPYIKDVEGSGEHEKWNKLVSGIKNANNLLDNQKRLKENDKKGDLSKEKELLKSDK